jgi:hypothetical protein
LRQTHESNLSAGAAINALRAADAEVSDQGSASWSAVYRQSARAGGVLFDSLTVP